MQCDLRMPPTKKLPRRALQRSHVRRDKFATGKTASTARVPPTVSLLTPTWADQNQAGADGQTAEDTSDCGSDSDGRNDVALPPLSRIRATGSSKVWAKAAASIGPPSPEDRSPDSDSDSIMHSKSNAASFAEAGYCSGEDNSDREADFYCNLITQYEEEGPTMANHGENTKKMTGPEEKRWNEYVSSPAF